METIKIKSHVSNDTYANGIITDFTNNKLIIKGDTGIGGTTAVLNITDQTIIIISPISGMIMGKEKIRQPHQMFIYQDSKDRWHHFESELRRGNNVVLNTTPEQIIEVKKNNNSLYDKIMQIPFFIDESQVYAESDYRASMSVFYDILFNEHKANFTLSTATPTYKNLDIPKYILNDMRVYKIEREVKRVKKITISPLNNYWNFIKSNCDKGNKVVLFTNDLNKIKNVLNEDNLGYKTQILVGDTLAVKTSGVKTKTYQEFDDIVKAKIDETADVYILSTKYQIGFDLDFDASIGIIMDEFSNVDCYNVNQVNQSYGRVRGTVLDAQIFYRSSKSNTTNINQLERQINQIDFDKGYLKIIQPLINEINHALSYPKANLINSLNDYGFTVNDEDTQGTVVETSVNFPIKYRNLINQEDQDVYIIKKELERVYSNIKGDDTNFNGFGKKDLLLWATAYMAVETQSDYLLNATADRYERLLNTAKTFIDVNDLANPDKMSEMDKITKFRVSKTQMDIAIKNGALCQLKEDETMEFGLVFSYNWDDAYFKAKQVINSLYVIQMIENGQYSEETKRIVYGFSVVSECILNDYIKALSTESNQDVKALINGDNREALDKLTKEYSKSLIGKRVFNNTNRAIVNQLSKLDGYSQLEFNQIMDKAEKIKNSLLACKHGIRNTVKMNTYSIEKQVERHKYYILSLLSLSCAGHMFGFKTTSIDNRVFNTATKTTRQLRGYTPYQLIQCDIKSAFASFLDTLVGSNIAQEVYCNLEKKYKIERSEAKIWFNMMLNDNKRTVHDAKTFFKACGYTKDQVAKIIELTLAEKGSFYKTMTKMEDNLIEDFKYINRLDYTAVRLHDAIIIYNTPEFQNLTSVIGKYEFDIKLI
ncbi:hypothetical protein [Flavobacterium sp. N1719]|uniref:hypothetical protein n=1 Tax=Flavobacterium sp. N1719 TaxID=2885633 RepID=UPI00222387AD|nr:hypothetical protein [Flavobacterium sp. N1719]